MTQTSRKKNSNTESSSDTKQCQIPALLVPFQMVDPDASAELIPTHWDYGVYHLKTATDINLDLNRDMMCHTGIKVNLSKFIDASPCYGIPVGADYSVFPRFSLHARISSIFSVVVDHGLMVLGPTILTPGMMEDREIIVYVRNIGTKPCIMKTGESIAEFTICVSPLCELLLNHESENENE